MSIKIYFDDLENVVQRELLMAQKSVKIAIAWITFSNYQTIFKTLVNNKVEVEILVSDSDKLQKDMSYVNTYRAMGIKVRICKMPSKYNYMHHKFAIIDDEVILNGSFNWTFNAGKNFENLSVINGEPNLVSDFLLEYNKIKSLDDAAIKSLQAIKTCSRNNCSGSMVNLLIFDSNPQKMTYEAWGDIISVCSSCENSNSIKLGIQDTTLHLEFMSYESCHDDEDRLLLDRAIDELYTGYHVSGVLIHGIGFTYHELVYPDSEIWGTSIKWKNKFVAKFIEDIYQDTFGVQYT